MNPSYIFGVIQRIFEVYFKCDVCPQPHRVVLCAAHARPVLHAVEPFYAEAEDGESCRVCDLVDEFKKKFADDPPTLERALGNLDGLMEHVLKFKIKGVA